MFDQTRETFRADTIDSGNSCANVTSHMCMQGTSYYWLDNVIYYAVYTVSRAHKIALIWNRHFSCLCHFRGSIDLHQSSHLLLMFH